MSEARQTLIVWIPVLKQLNHFLIVFMAHVAIPVFEALWS